MPEMFTDWDENKGSSGPVYYSFGNYDVTQAKRFLNAAPRPDHPLELAGYSAFLPMLSGVHSSGLPPDLTVPLITVPVQAGLLPIDGWGRIREAIHEGKPSLQAVKLTIKEANAIRSDGVKVGVARLRPMLERHGIGEHESPVISLLRELGVTVVDE